MMGLKRLYLFILKSFVPLFVMTFFICLFIVLMQFLWRYIDDLVGKGLGVEVIGELFFYAALTMIPMALPLAILLASLMTFGNLGEHFELTAIKAAGVSLLRVMKPLIALIILIAIGAFFFQNNVLPIAQTKMWTLLFSMRQKSPELEIPEGVFYDQIPGYNLFVQDKDRDSGVLYGIMIYDLSKGFDNANIILADSGRMAMMEDKTHLFLRLWQGESFENLREAGRSLKNVPYRRESFTQKDILVPFDANFNRMDEEGMRSQYVGKNIAELRVTIDSLQHHTDSLGTAYGKMVAEQPYMGLSYSHVVYHAGSAPTEEVVADVHPKHNINVDSMFKGSSSASQVGYIRQAINKANYQKQENEFRGMVLKEERKLMRKHDIEMQKKFTLSFACIIFFFIGAPLGAIIRKGGLGMPLIISVILFIVYYIIDNTGYKLARDGKWEVWAGMWLSAAVLLPMGIFFTYKAMRDSAVFNLDAYYAVLRKLRGVSQKRSLTKKDVVIDDVEPALAEIKLLSLQDEANQYLQDNPPKPNYFEYWLHGYSRSELRKLQNTTEDIVKYLSNSRDIAVINKVAQLPILRSLWLYHPTNYKPTAWIAIALFPISIPIYLLGLNQLSELRKEINTIVQISDELIEVARKKQIDNNG